LVMAKKGRYKYMEKCGGKKRFRKGFESSPDKQGSVGIHGGGKVKSQKRGK